MATPATDAHRSSGLPPRIEPRDDGAAVVVGVHGLADALAEVNRLLAAY
jgi:hypothetical protein